MCGLAGIILKKQNRSENTYEEIGTVVASLLESAMVRGVHATGIAMIDRDGSSMILKRPESASNFIRTDNFVEAMFSIDNDTGAVLGHTRYATKGSPLRNRNNHPIKAGTVIGTHNGWISNDDELFKEYNLERYAEVDSEVLFRMCDAAPNLAEYTDKMLPKVKGMVSMVWADTEFPEYVYIFKGNNPLEMAYLKEYKMFAYASTKKILLDGLMEAIPDTMLKWVELPYDTLMRIDTSSLKVKKETLNVMPASNSFELSVARARRVTAERGITSHGAPAPLNKHKKCARLYKPLKPAMVLTSRLSTKITITRKGVQNEYM